jgi:cell division protein FtsI/penicillin-binding protein 2
MAKRTQLRRLLLLAVVVCLALTGLGYRLVDLQVLRHDELSLKAQQNTQREFLLEPRRGDILDAKGNLLATSLFVKTVCADPTFVGNRQVEVAHAIAPLLQLNEAKLVQALTPRLRAGSTNNAGVTNLYYQYVPLKQKVPLETWERVQVTMNDLSFGMDEKKLPKAEQTFYRNLRQKAIFAETDQLRVYPNQTLAAHVLGYASTEDKRVNDKAVKEIVGMDGIERTFNTKLAGVRGWRLTETDRAHREVVTLRDQDVEARDGFDVVLTIDSVIQHIVEEALAQGMAKHVPISISGLVIRPRTGEILALATLPNFDPNTPGSASPDARRNRVIADIAEPGSVFKIVVISGALNDATVKLTDIFNCEHGRFAFAGRVLHDHEPYDNLTVEQIITYSSNIGAAKVGIKMGENRLYDYIRSFGFAKRTGIPLPGEVSGIVHPLKAWSKVSIAQIPMGQGIAVSRLQMTMAMCAIANQGRLMRPMLIDRLEDGAHNIVAKYSPQPAQQVLSEAAAREMVQALKTVVSPKGTAPKAAMEHYTVAGKTGTAQKVENGVYVHGKYFASFVGFFPADAPEVCISITLDEPRHGGYYGGGTAGPIFKQIAEKVANYLNIRPEDGDGLSETNTVAAPADTHTLKTAAARLR